MSNFVRFGLNYAKVSNEFINELSNDINNQAERTNLKTLTNTNKGDEVVISEGPLAGLKGLYQCKDGLERSILLLNILCKENKVVIENDHFDKIN